MNFLSRQQGRDAGRGDGLGTPRVAALILAAALSVPGTPTAEAAPSRARQAETKLTPADVSKSNVRVASAAAPSGPLQIVVSLSQQRLTVFSAGVAVMSSPVSSGQAGFETPAGLYTILQKNRHHESNIYSGAPMPFMQRITWSGIALHEGNLPGRAASHGCIRLPGAFASKLFGVTKTGARVIVARDPLTPRPFEHDKLFKPEQERPAAATPQPEGLVQTAQANWTSPVRGNTAAASTLSVSNMSDAPAALSQPRTRNKAPSDTLVSVLISRQTGKIYIRQNFEALHEAPITIQDPDLPLGTHLFTAIGFNSDKTKLVWNVVTYPLGAQKVAQTEPRGRLPSAARTDASTGITRSWITPPGAALERIAFGDDLTEILAEVARPGMSLIITDHGPGPETGKGTEFVIQPK